MQETPLTVHVPLELVRSECPHCAYTFGVYATLPGPTDCEFEQVSAQVPAFCSACGRSLQEIAELEPSAPLVTYAQRDPRWTNVKLGFGNTTIGRYGCVLCCLTMASERARGEALLPPDANALIKGADGYVGVNKNRVSWKAAGESLGLAYEWSRRWSLTPASVDEIQDAVAQGKLVLLQMDFDPSDDDIDEHWVLVRESLGDGRFVIDDPWTGGVHEFPPAYCRSGWDAARGIFGAVCYSGE